MARALEQAVLLRMTAALRNIFSALGSEVPAQALQQATQGSAMSDIISFAARTRHQYSPAEISNMLDVMNSSEVAQKAFVSCIKGSGAIVWLQGLLSTHIGLVPADLGSHPDQHALLHAGNDQLKTCCNLVAAAATFLLAVGGDARSAAMAVLPQMAGAVPLLCPDDLQATARWLAAHTAALKHAHSNATRKAAGAKDAELLAGLVATYAQVGPWAL